MDSFQNDWMTRQEAADALTVSTQTVDRLIHDGRLTACNLGRRAVRIDRASVLAVLAQARAARVGMRAAG